MQVSTLAHAPHGTHGSTVRQARREPETWARVARLCPGAIEEEGEGQVLTVKGGVKLDHRQSGSLTPPMAAAIDRPSMSISWRTASHP